MRLIFRQQMSHDNGLTSFMFVPIEPLSWTAGQSVRLELPAPDYGTNERRFTISSAPHEATITITTRHSTSEFKQSLFALKAGQSVDAYSIEGDFTWDHAEPVTFAAIGVGITPFYAILKQRAYEGKPLNATLFYTGKNSLPFAADFYTWQANHPDFVLKQLDQRLQAESLCQYAANKTIYISGPQSSVTALKQELVQNFGLSTDAVKTDLFTGNLPAES